ncbi:MAG: aldo/keto reductase [Bacteroidales bacterium]|nr:aldo/keto reductase [Bacteroidales bacterium]
MGKDISRRDFIKAAGAGALALGTAAACKPGSGRRSDPAAGISEGMPLRTNPNTGDKVSILGYGCMRWQMIQGPDGRQIVDQDSVNELVDYALANGVNYFDTSPVYLQGQSEAAAGIALSRHPRNSYYLATKLSNQSGDPSFERSVQMYRDSFKNLQTDYIDYYLIHIVRDGNDWRRRAVDNGMMDFLVREREAGCIRNLGLSVHPSRSGFDEVMTYHEKYHFDFCQIQMNYVDWYDGDAEYLYNELDKRGIPVVIMEPLLGGRLSSVPKVVADQFKEREPDASVASWAFRFCGSKPRVLTALSGMTYMEHLQDNLKTFLNFKPLTDEEMDFLKEAAGLIKNYPLIDCTNCQYCMPCPYGIDIPTIFKHYNSCVNDGYIAQSTDQKDFKKLKKIYLTTYDKAIETVRQADHCISCNQCSPHCPQHIRIPQELRRIDQYVESLKQETL